MIQFINENQAIVQGGDGYGCGYMNSPAGRAELAAECPPDVVSEVLAVWGNTPTMPDAPEIAPEPLQAERATLAALKAQLTATDYKAIKYAEGWLSAEEYTPIRAQRQEWREEINRLEAVIEQ